MEEDWKRKREKINGRERERKKWKKEKGNRKWWTTFILSKVILLFSFSSFLSFYLSLSFSLSLSFTLFFESFYSLSLSNFVTRRKNRVLKKKNVLKERKWKKKEKWKWKETQTFVALFWTILEDFESTMITLQTVYLMVNTKQNNFLSLLSLSLSLSLSFSLFLSFSLLFLSLSLLLSLSFFLSFSTLLDEVFKQSLRTDVSSYSPLMVRLTWNSFHWLKNEEKVKKLSKTTFVE